MYMAAHKCHIINASGGKTPKIPSVVPGPGVVGPKQMIASFQKSGNNVEWKQGEQVPTYSPRMGYLKGTVSLQPRSPYYRGEWCIC